MKVKIIKKYKDSQLKKTIKVDTILDVKTKKRVEELVSAGVAEVIEDIDAEDTEDTENEDANAEA